MFGTIKKLILKDRADRKTFWREALSIGVAFGGLIPVMPSASYAEGNLDEAVISGGRSGFECTRENLSIKEQIHEKEEEHRHSSGFSISTKPISDTLSLYQNVDKAITLHELRQIKAEVELQRQEYQKALHQDIAKDLQEKGLSKKEAEAQINRVEHVNKTLDAMKEDLELSRLKAVKAIEKERTQKALDERLIPSEERVSKEEATYVLDEAKNKQLGGILDGKSLNIYQDFVKEQQAILAHYGKEIETTSQKLVGAAKEYAEAAQNFVHGFYQEIKENPLGMAQAFAYEVGDFVVPGGLDAPTAFIKGEMGMAELMGRQSANIACEVATGYALGKVVKGVVKLGKYSAKTIGKLAHKISPRVFTSRELGHILKAEGNDAIALVEKLTQKCEVEHALIFQTHLKSRSSRGISQSTYALSENKMLLKGTEGNAGYVPKEIGEKLVNKEYKNFDDFRKDFWQTTAESSYANEFSQSNIARMKNGNAPIVMENQAVGKRRSYELHHITPIKEGGEVFDLSNILIVTPKFHMEVLEKGYHFGRKIGQ